MAVVSLKQSYKTWIESYLDGTFPLLIFVHPIICELISERIFNQLLKILAWGIKVHVVIKVGHKFGTIGYSIISAMNYRFFNTMGDMGCLYYFVGLFSR